LAGSDGDDPENCNHKLFDHVNHKS
jgi:hypothetical protein